MKTTLAAVTVALLAVAGYFGFERYERREFIKALVPPVKNASLRIENSARYEVEDGSQISYGELISRLTADIQEIDSRLIDIQSMSTPKTATIAEPAVAYLQSGQEYLRALLQKARKRLILKDAIDRSNNSLRQAEALAHPTRESDTAILAMADARIDSERNYSSAIHDVATTAGRLRECRERMVPIFADDALVPLPQIDKVIEKNSQKSNATIGQPATEKGK